MATTDRSRVGQRQGAAVDRCLLWLGFLLAICAFYLYRVEYLLTYPAVEPYYDRDTLGVARTAFIAVTAACVILMVIGLAVRRRTDPPPWIFHASCQIWWMSAAIASYALGPVTTPILGLLLLGGVLSTMLFARRVVVPALVGGMSILVVTTVAERTGFLPYAPLFGSSPAIDGRLSTEYVVAMSSIAFFVIVSGFVLSSFIVERGHARERALIETGREREQARIELTQARDELEQRVTDRTIELTHSNRRLVEEASERKRAQQVLAEKERRLREQVTELELLYLNAPVGLCFLDPELRFVRINERLAEINGAPVAAHIGRTVRETIPEIAPEVEPVMRRVLATGTPAVNEELFARAPGEPSTERHWLTSYYPVQSAEGGALGVVIVVQDISELRLAEERARQHLETLAHVSRLATMGQMATGIAHELNQPLAAISNYAFAGRKLVRDGGDPTEIARIFDELGTLALRAGAVVHHLRGFVKKKTAAPERLPTSANTLVGDVLTLLGSTLRLNGVEPVLQLDEALPEVRADTIQIQQVVLNLIRNALDAMAELDASRRRLTITTTSGTGTVEVAVRDSGPGISPENLSKVFDEFYSTKEEGMGMGLAISRSIIEDHGGKLWAEAHADGGSTFRFTLPVVHRDGSTHA